MDTASARPGEHQKSLAQRLWLYQAERFPLARFGVMVSTFAFSGLCLSAMLRAAPPLPSAPVYLVAAVVTLLFFFQLRVADEFKDHEHDCRYQPYRPVPRGLVTLQELAAIAFACGTIQLLLVASCSLKLLVPLFATWCYMGLMTKEFFVSEWLRKRPIAYLGSHMFVMVFIDIFITACDWLRVGAPIPTGIYTFLCVSVCNGLIIEFGRKMRAPDGEEEGVETYTSLWGTRISSYIWMALLVIAFGFALFTASMVNFVIGGACLLTVVVALAFITGTKFCTNPDSKLAKNIENLSGLWIITAYLVVGAIPAILKYVHQ